MNVLVIAAHPDDESFGPGGTIARHVAAGDRVDVLILTDGVSARHDKIEQQLQAARQACAVLGVADVRTAGLADQRLDNLPLLDTIRPISEAVEALQPEIVYTHHHGDVNQDHSAAFEATMIAVRPLAGSPVRQVLSYEVPSSTEWAPPLAATAFLANVYVDIESTLETKLRAIACYRNTYQSEVKSYPHPRSPEAVRLRAQERGLVVGMSAAEAFMLIRELR